MIKFKQFLMDEEAVVNVTANVAGVKAGDESPVKKKKSLMVYRTKPVDITR
jgi:hypothetical protein